MEIYELSKQLESLREQEVISAIEIKVEEILEELGIESDVNEVQKTVIYNQIVNLINECMDTYDLDGLVYVKNK